MLVTRFSMVHLDKSLNISNYVVPIFYKTSSNADRGNEYYRAINCNERFPEAPEEMKDQYYDDLEHNLLVVSTGYLCPDIDSIEILNDGLQVDIQQYSNFQMQIVYCDVAADRLRVDVGTCETNHTLVDEWLAVHQVMRIDTKFIT